MVARKVLWPSTAAALIALLLALTPPPAAAAPPPSDREDAAKLLGLGIQLQKAGRHLEALKVFEDAYGKVPHVKIRYYTMQSYQALGRIGDARRVLVEIMEDPALQDRRRKMEELKKTFDQALTPRPVRITVTGAPAASVFIDGEARGKAPLLVELVPRSYLIRVEAKGFDGQSKTVTVPPGHGTISVTFDLLPRAVVDPKPDEKPKEPLPRPTEVPSWRRWVPWTLIGTGIAASLGSVGYFVKHAVDTGKLEEGDTQSPVNLIGGGVFLGVGIGLITTGILLFPDEPKPSATTGSAGLSLNELGALPIEGGGIVILGGRF